jgi:hypothetical protein
MIALLWIAVPLVGWLAYRARKDSTAAAIPHFDMTLPTDRARAVQIAIGQGRGASGPIPGDTDAASVRAFAATLDGFPIAQSALSRYASSIGGADG